MGVQDSFRSAGPKRAAPLAIGGALVVGLTLAACGTTGASGPTGSYPKKVEVVIPASPGGGWDATARTVGDVLGKEDLYPAKKITYVNKEGGGGVTGFTYLLDRPSDSVAVNSSLLITKHLMDPDAVKITADDFTPLAILTTEWVAFGVKADSKYKTLEEVFKDVAADDGKAEADRKVALGVGTALGTDDHFAALQVAKLAGVKGKVPFRVYSGGGAEAVNALLSGEVDLIVGSQSELQTAHEDGELRILGVSSDVRQVGLEDVPTFQEAGFDLVFPHWRGWMGPKDMTAEEIAFWDDTLGKAVKTDYWEEQMATHAWTTFYKPSAEAKKYIAEQSALFEQLVDEFDLGR